MVSRSVRISDALAGRASARRAAGAPEAAALPPRIAGRDGLSVRVIENALILAATRRLIRPADAPSLGTIRSLAYFLPVIEEALELRVSPDYFQYLRHKLERIAPTYRSLQLYSTCFLQFVF